MKKIETYEIAYRDILLRILDYLEFLQDGDSYKVYISTETNCYSVFKRLSSRYAMGVKAKSGTVGHTLLFLLKMIIDQNFVMGQYNYDDNERKILWYSTEDLADFYSLQMLWSSETFECDSPKLDSDIDLYDLSRIRDIIKKIKINPHPF